ncbi:MAG: formate dehydrogenase accessory sulfurtransferase FdhD [Acidobacteria bacterium]|nr:formate dehydrogenase accessory sulfurtransferase FdhD [Acidobacteriota bacterium]MDW7983056.1 formate dehydrogenase accessory sulfurtransferase FdhD [Acidobacteriota bacterium]
MTERPSSTTRVPVWEVCDGRLQYRDDELATEEPLEVRVLTPAAGQWVCHRVAVTLRTPGHDFELAAGFLYTEGVIPDRRAIVRIAYCTDPSEPQQYNVVNVYLGPGIPFDPERLSRHVYINSSCGVCGKAALELVRTVCARTPVGDFQLAPDFFRDLPEILRSAQRIFARTGGLHASALFDRDGRLILLREDVGRHNAMDKLVGALLLEDRLPASNTVVLVSGRASFELVQKALLAGIPVLAAVGAPSSLAVDVARAFGMTLIGFLREGRFNVYAGATRIQMGR